MFDNESNTQRQKRSDKKTLGKHARISMQAERDSGTFA